jgi:hypothetical protein
MKRPMANLPKNVSDAYPRYYASRVPDLDHEDLKTIKFLVDNYGKEKIPIFCKKLMRKVQESLRVYEWEKRLINKAKINEARTN